MNRGKFGDQHGNQSKTAKVFYFVKTKKGK